MRLSQIDLFGLYVAPIAGILVVSWIAMIILRRLIAGTGLLGHVWHPALFGMAIYLIVVSCLALAIAP